MVKDGKLSDTRALSGSMGGRPSTSSDVLLKQNQKQNESKTLSKTKANSVIAIAIDNTTVNENINKERTLGNDTSRVRAYEGDELAKIMAYYDAMIGSLPPPRVCAALSGYLDCMEPAVIIDAVDIAAAENKRTWSYVDGILKSRKSSGIKNIADVARENERWKNSKSGKASKNGNPFLEMLKEEDEFNDKNRYETVDGDPEGGIPELLQGHPN
jgi:DnaD/phage-associated family protein